ncbi:hypothetical protein H8356DRAFT_1431097 [Neocallimastix lanati (nom. inval.)]|nr:hypothetical protein H8356DRAFT_1431097 [Neocallimastix sp. JGI-2020a]
MALQQINSIHSRLIGKKTKVFGYRPGNNSSAFNVSTHEGAGTFQALANKELTSPKANWASGL